MVTREGGETAMWQRHFCPNCGATVIYGARFCGKCGANLSRTVVQHMTAQPSPASCGCQYNNQQPECSQQSEQNQPQPYYQASARESPNQYHEFRPNSNINITAKRKSSQVSDPTTELRTEIFKLLAELFDKQIEDN